jgi:hypothetical protein
MNIALYLLLGRILIRHEFFHSRFLAIRFEVADFAEVLGKQSKTPFKVASRIKRSALFSILRPPPNF